jgi:acylphosphatase
MKRLEARLTGHVQGVGFRANTRREAKRLGLTGWVRNNADGSVSVVAEGDEETLQELVSFLHEGPRVARVDDVSVDYEPLDAREFKDFTIKRG